MRALLVPAGHSLTAHPGKGLFVSYPRYMVPDNRKHLRPISDVDRAAWEHLVERPQVGAWRYALDNMVVAAGGGPGGRSPLAAIFAFSESRDRPINVGQIVIQ